MRRSETGFTLVELLIALFVLAVVTSQLFLVFTTQKEAYVTNERILDVQEDARLVMDLLVSETRMAGFMVDGETAISSVDGGAGGSDIFCVSDPGVFDETEVVTAVERFDSAVVSALDAGGDIATLSSAAEFDLDSDGNVDFVEGRGIIISDGANTHCARITLIDTATRQIDYAPLIDDPTAYALASTRAVPAVVYEVGAGGGLGLSRNNMLLSSEVEDLQVEFGVDANLDDVLDETDSAEFPLDTLTGTSPERVRSVRLTVITRTAQADPEYDGPGFPGAANRDAGASDGFRRRRFIARALPRNLL